MMSLWCHFLSHGFQLCIFCRMSYHLAKLKIPSISNLSGWSLTTVSGILLFILLLIFAHVLLCIRFLSVSLICTYLAVFKYLSTHLAWSAACICGLRIWNKNNNKLQFCRLLLASFIDRFIKTQWWRHNDLISCCQDLKISFCLKLLIDYHLCKFQISWLSGSNFMKVSLRYHIFPLFLVMTSLWRHLLLLSFQICICYRT